MNVRLIFRGLRRSPGFLAGAVATIALAVTLASTVYAVVDGVLFKPLPYHRPGELFVLGGLPSEGMRGQLSLLDVLYLREAPTGARIATFAGSLILRHPEQPSLRLSAGYVDQEFFDVLGLWPAAGGFLPEHFTAVPRGQPGAAVISHRVWRDFMGADANAIGRVLELIDRRFVVAGVLPPYFVHPHFSGRSQPDILLPMVDAPEERTDRWSQWRNAIVRMGSGVRPADAQAAFDSILAARVHEYGPKPDAQRSAYTHAYLRPLVEELGSNERPMFRAAFGCALLLIALACVNVAGLVSARMRDRAHEFDVLLGLGAPRGTIARLVFSEIGLITLAGAAAGFAAAPAVLASVRHLFPPYVLFIKEPVIDPRVAVFAFAVPAAAMFLAAAAPVVAASRRASSRLTTTTRTYAPGTHRGRVLLAIECAIGIVLCVAGTLVLSSFVMLRSRPLGMQAKGLGVVDVLLTPRPQDLAARAALQDRVLERLRQVPGVSHAAIVGAPFLENLYPGSSLEPPSSDSEYVAHEVPVSSGFFETANLETLDGRLPSAEEIDAGHPVMVVTETVRRAYWPEQRAIGQTVMHRGHAFTVVAVTADVRMGAQTEGRWGEVFTPIGPSDRLWATYLIRAGDDIETTVASAGASIARDVRGVRVRRAESVDLALLKTVRLPHFQAVLFGVGGTSALLLIATGIVGLVAINVRRRWRELGIRSALGADHARLIRMVVFDHMRPALVGVVAGLLIGWQATAVLEHLLYETEPRDLRLWALASAVLVGLSVVAAWLAARRVARVDPASALRD